MSAHHHHHHALDHSHSHAPGYRPVLWLGLLINASMFGIEIATGLKASSLSLLADAIDFFSDSVNYGLTLAVLNLSLAWRARAAAVKATSMLIFGMVVVGRALWSFGQAITPEPVSMGVVATLALAANVGVAALLYAYRGGDANMRGIWLCARNDAVGNLAVLLAALGVLGTGTAWPDLIVALVMASLAISAGWVVLRQARKELAQQGPQPE